MRHTQAMRDSPSLPFASTSLSKSDKGDDSFVSHKAWSMQRLSLLFRRQHVVVQVLLALAGIYMLSWSASVVLNLFASKSEDPKDIFDAAIVVLGGGLTATGALPPHTQLRVDEAIRMYRSLNGQARIITLSGGTPYKPNPLDSKGFPILEATAAARELLQRGIPADHVFEEAFSLDTIGNVSTPFDILSLLSKEFNALHLVLVHGAADRHIGCDRSTFIRVATATCTSSRTTGTCHGHKLFSQPSLLCQISTLANNDRKRWLQRAIMIPIGCTSGCIAQCTACCRRLISTRRSTTASDCISSLFHPALKIQQFSRFDERKNKSH